MFGEAESGFVTTAAKSCRGQSPGFAADEADVQKGGFYHERRFPDLAPVVDHDTVKRLNLSVQEKPDLIDFLKVSLMDPPPCVACNRAPQGSAKQLSSRAALKGVAALPVLANSALEGLA
jgi:hypothetical protein